MSGRLEDHTIVQVGLGPVGVRIAQDVLDRGIGRLVAGIDPSPDLCGRSLADILSRPLVDTPVVAHVGEVEPVPDCAIVATQSRVDACMPLFRELLERGIRVVSTCEELVFPWLNHPKLAQELDTLARANDTAILGTGVNPGFLMDLLPAAATSVCRDVRTISVHRIQDAQPRRGPFQEKIGAGLTPAQFEERVAGGAFGHVGLGESIHLLAETLGLDFDRWHEHISPVIATGEMESAMGLIAHGDVCGILQFAHAFSDDEKIIELVFQAAVGEPNPHDRIHVDGDPPVDLVIKGGVHGDIATAAIVVNALRPLVVAPPGLHTMASLPVPGWFSG